MNGTQIAEKLKSNCVTAPYFIGICSQDELVNIPRKRDGQHVKPNSFIVVNTDTENGMGKHWVSLFIFDDHYTEFFDSLAHYPDYYSSNFTKFLKQVCSKFAMNTREIQSQTSTMCGEFCIYYCYHRCLGKSFRNIINTFSSTNLNSNDKIVHQFTASL